jgi:hypothetical protein
VAESLPSARGVNIDLQALGRALLRDQPEDFRQAPETHQALIDELERRRELLLTRLRPELEAVEAAASGNRVRTLFRIILILAAAAVLTFSVTFGAGLLEPPFFDGWWFRIGVAAVSVVFLSTGLVRQQVQAWAARRSARRRLERAAEKEAGDLLREIINEWSSEEVLWGGRFDSTYAPTLVGVGVENAIPSATYTELVRFVSQHPTSAIGIAGPRGVGKSTLMEKLKDDPSLRCLGVRIPSPKRYEPGGLVRLIHSRVAREVLRVDSDFRVDSWTRTPRRSLLQRSITVAALVLAVVVLVVLWMLDQEERATSFDEPYGWHVRRTTIFLLVATGILGGVLIRVAWNAAWDNLFLVGAPTTRIKLARRQLEFLRYSTATQSKVKGEWRGGAFRFGAEDQLSRSERDLTEAEYVEALRSFLTELTTVHRTRVIICIDELDKMDQPEDVVAVVNGVKDLFHLPDVHVLVSVSTDAMHTFAARGVLVRDVFDSAFDTVVEVRRMGPDETRELLSRRATNFSVPAMLFCHAWAGGHPRDLIRTARKCVAFRARHRHSVPLPELVDAVLLQDTLDVLRATVEKLRSEQSADANTPDVVPDVLAFTELLREDEAPFHARVRAALAATTLPQVKDTATEAGAMVNALGAYLTLAAALSEFFAQRRTPAQWQDARTADAVQAFATAQGSLSRHPAEAERAVADATRRAVAGVPAQARPARTA